MREPIVGELRREVELLVRLVGHWGPPRWSVTAARGDRSRADLVHALVQRLADLGADAEGRARHSVPRLDNDLALPDQIRVVAMDLERVAPPAVLTAAAAEVAATRAAL